MYVPMPITDIALLLRHGMLYKKLVPSVTKMLDHYKDQKEQIYLPERIVKNQNKIIKEPEKS